MPQLLPSSLLCLSLMLGAAAQADELAAAQKLWLAGQRDAAVQQVQSALQTGTDTLRLRFALGVMRLELGQLDQARTIFVQLTQDYPDLADPFNNLAVIHATTGELDLAQEALQHALRLRPDHAQAQENLGDVLLRQAARAYQHARQSELTPNAALENKWKLTQALTRELQLVR